MILTWYGDVSSSAVGGGKIKKQEKMTLSVGEREREKHEHLSDDCKVPHIFQEYSPFQSIASLNEKIHCAGGTKAVQAVGSLAWGSWKHSWMQAGAPLGKIFEQVAPCWGAFP